MSSTLERITDTASGMVMYGPIALAKLLPYRLRIPFLGWLTARLVAPVAGYDTRVRDNLAHVLPDLPKTEVCRLMRAVPDNAGRNMAELFSTAEFIARTRKSRVYGPGLKAIRAARADGRPIIFVTGHFGSFNAARIAMIEQGFKMGVFYRPMANKWFNTRYIAAMGALSQPMFEQGRRGMMQMVKHLRDGGALAILTDLNAHDGVPLNFFGKPALSSPATAELALKFNAPLVPTWGIRKENGLDFQILIDEPVAHSDPITMTQTVNDRLEHQVRERMDQWFWIHRRWKDGTGPLADRGARHLADRQKN
ncbi:KDO2-lipid IV(A) lauroyltransferase [Roseovarius marisflavi]|uniref:KDO2-lipid IV(A) lauroyltransferase n=1 Tax=Roseovarius marisflavi TaxID=1054996 RepID=A0A1M7CBK0_9RHOB|nr:lysophospholipid acyltransferase family protein [Roseovarius marisflavi]SHL64594.1 KDO2-lipid IV(A) lauroyltransferase [Roseovarius marisflavi]